VEMGRRQFRLESDGLAKGRNGSRKVARDLQGVAEVVMRLAIGGSAFDRAAHGGDGFRRLAFAPERHAEIEMGLGESLVEGVASSYADIAPFLLPALT